MSDETTPAVERAARFLYPTLGGPNANWEIDNSREALDVALPADELAKIIWIADTPATHGITTRHRRIAAAIRTAILGSGS